MNEHPLFELIRGPVPGPRSLELAATLARFESRGVTYLAKDFPVFWQSASGALVTDVDDNRYIDLTSAFGVANTGHTNPYVGAAIADQAVRLVHGMGDVHPTEVRVQLLEKLASIAPAGLQKTFLCSTGAEAVEFALKTAYLKTHKPHVLAYENSYHGLSLGALSVSGIAKFREPFAPLVTTGTTWLPYPTAANGTPAALIEINEALARDPQIGAIILEPIQGRGGIIVPPPGFLAGVRTICDRAQIVMILDEIYTGFGRTGAMFACDIDGVVPDLMCVGKAIANGVPLSATIGRADVMDAWETSTGEALHTSTYLGNPLACAAALANIDEIQRLNLITTVRGRAQFLAERLFRLRKYTACIRDIRGLGYMWAIECTDPAIATTIVKQALGCGVILLQSGPTGSSITIAPPLTIEPSQIERAIGIVESIVENVKR